MPRNRPGAKASHEVLGHPRGIHLVTLWAKKGKNSCAIGLDLSTQFWRVLSGGWDGAIVLGSLQLRGLRQFNPSTDKTKPRCFSTWAFLNSGGESAKSNSHKIGLSKQNLKLV